MFLATNCDLKSQTLQNTPPPLFHTLYYHLFKAEEFWVDAFFYYHNFKKHFFQAFKTYAHVFTVETNASSSCSCCWNSTSCDQFFFYFIFDFYSGDLETCRQGATIRLGLRPADLRDGMVFFDSFPVRLYYKDGRLFGQLQTATQIWTVSASDFRPGLWQRVIHICILN